MMRGRDYVDIAQAIYDIDTWDDQQLIAHSMNITQSIADVLFYDNPDRFDEDKFKKHALKGIEYKE